MTSEAKQYQLEHEHIFMGKVLRTGEPFKFGFVTENGSNTTAIDKVHGVWMGAGTLQIETVNKFDIKIQDTVNLGDFGFGKVAQISVVHLNPLQMRFVKPDQADKIMRISVQSTGTKNV